MSSNTEENFNNKESKIFQENTEECLKNTLSDITNLLFASIIEENPENPVLSSSNSYNIY